MEEGGAQKQEREVKGNGDLSFSHTIKPLLLFGGEKERGDIGSASSAEKQSQQSQETGELGCEDQLPTR